ncbi:hypothetical protein HDU93_007280 [Gonapodya sp. JEL0774]|nr:hypothetical protein HDU93_007280 [Gonapodya sp. JEL0774]
MASREEKLAAARAKLNRFKATRAAHESLTPSGPLTDEPDLPTTEHAPRHPLGPKESVLDTVIAPPPSPPREPPALSLPSSPLPKVPGSPMSIPASPAHSATTGLTSPGRDSDVFSFSHFNRHADDGPEEDPPRGRRRDREEDEMHWARLQHLQTNGVREAPLRSPDTSTLAVPANALLSQGDGHSYPDMGAASEQQSFYSSGTITGATVAMDDGTLTFGAPPRGGSPTIYSNFTTHPEPSPASLLFETPPTPTSGHPEDSSASFFASTSDDARLTRLSASLQRAEEEATELRWRLERDAVERAKEVRSWADKAAEADRRAREAERTVLDMKKAAEAQAAIEADKFRESEVLSAHAIQRGGTKVGLTAEAFPDRIEDAERRAHNAESALQAESKARERVEQELEHLRQSLTRQETLISHLEAQLAHQLDQSAQHATDGSASLEYDRLREQVAELELELVGARSAKDEVVAANMGLTARVEELEREVGESKRIVESVDSPSIPSGIAGSSAIAPAEVESLLRLSLDSFRNSLEVRETSLVDLSSSTNHRGMDLDDDFGSSDAPIEAETIDLTQGTISGSASEAALEGFEVEYDEEDAPGSEVVREEVEVVKDMLQNQNNVGERGLGEDKEEEAGLRRELKKYLTSFVAQLHQTTSSSLAARDSRIGQLSAELEACRAQLNSQSAESDQLRVRADKAEEARRDIYGKLERARPVIDGLVTQLRGKDGELKRERDERERISKELEEARRSAADFRAASAAGGGVSAAALATLERDLENARAQANSYRESLKRVEVTASELRRERDMAVSKLPALEQRARELDNEIRQVWQVETEKLNGEVRAAETAKVRLEEKTKAMSEQVLQLEVQRRELENALRDARGRMQTLETAMAEVEVNRANEIGQLTQQMSKLMDENRELSKTLEQVAAKGEVDALQKQIVVLEGQRAELEMNLEDLQDSHESAIKERDELRVATHDLNDKILSLSAELQDLQALSESTITDRDSLRTICQDLNDRVETLLGQLRDHEREAEAHNSDIATLKAHITRLEAEALDVTHGAEVARLIQVSGKLEGEIRALHQKLEDVSVQRDGAVRERDILLRQVEEASRQGTELREQREQTEGALQDLKAKHAEAREDLQTLLETLKELTDQNATAKEQKRQWEAEREDLLKTIADLRREVGKLQAECARLKTVPESRHTGVDISQLEREISALRSRLELASSERDEIKKQSRVLAEKLRLEINGLDAVVQGREQTLQIVAEMRKRVQKVDMAMEKAGMVRATEA